MIALRILNNQKTREKVVERTKAHNISKVADKKK